MSRRDKENKKSKKVISFAIKLNSIFVKSLFLKFVILDMIIAFGVMGIWCAESEISYFGRISKDAIRTFDVDSINKVIYKVNLNSDILTKDSSTFVHFLLKLMGVIVTVELIFLFLQIIFGTAKNRKVLKPLNEIAEATSRLSDIAFDEERFHNLEEAISKISPESTNEKIYIGDSELQGLEDAINSLLDRMREAYRQQARFVSDASHELRTPISVIQGYANMLDRWGKEDEEVLEESIIAIKSESENMKNLVQQLLFLARGINGKIQLNVVKFSLNALMNEVYEESVMIDKDHNYIYKDTEEIIGYGDISLLKQTARILIENAAKYTDKGEEIILKIGKNEKDEPYFYVQDIGIGMDEKDVSHIFERFFRADTARTRKTGGTGLGLSIASWIINSHKGYFSVISRKGIGTRITVFLPYKHNG
ncbi:MAG: HAMP domain-containing histidine kinase [Clostridium sp.]|nr:HAMP domain-containing histidine kinase [Clostridium sp.]